MSKGSNGGGAKGGSGTGAKGGGGTGAKGGSGTGAKGSGGGSPGTGFPGGNWPSKQANIISGGGRGNAASGNKGS